jgi:hypothetical protein
MPSCKHCLVISGPVAGTPCGPWLNSDGPASVPRAMPGPTEMVPKERTCCPASTSAWCAAIQSSCPRATVCLQADPSIHGVLGPQSSKVIPSPYLMFWPACLACCQLHQGACCCASGNRSNTSRGCSVDQAVRQVISEPLGRAADACCQKQVGVVSTDC